MNMKMQCICSNLDVSMLFIHKKIRINRQFLLDGQIKQIALMKKAFWGDYAAPYYHKKFSDV